MASYNTESPTASSSLTGFTAKQLQPVMESLAPFFVTLPREVRDRIYDYVWLNTGAIYQRYKSKYCLVTYDLNPKTPLKYDWEEDPECGNVYSLDEFAKETLQANLPPGHQHTFNAKWLLTNKQMLQEGTKQLHQKSTWHFTDFVMHKLPYPPNYVFSLITPSAVRMQELVILHNNCLHFDTDTQIFSIRHELVAPQIAPSIDTAEATTPIDTMQVTMLCQGLEHYECPKATLTHSFSSLESLAAHGQLRRLVFQLWMWGDDWEQDFTCFGWLNDVEEDPTIIKAREAMYKVSFWEEISRVGRLIVKGGKERFDYYHNPRGMTWLYVIEK